MLCAFPNHFDHKSYLGRHDLKLLVQGYSRKHYQIIPIDLIKIICDYDAEFLFNCLSVPFYPALTIRFGRPVTVNKTGFESLSIYSKPINSISMKHNNFIVLGQLKTDSKKCFTWKVTFNRGDHQRCKKIKHQVGCVMIPKKKGYLTRFWSIINPNSNIDDIIQQFADPSVLGWWFNYCTPRNNNSFCSIQPNFEKKIVRHSDVYVADEITIYFHMNENGNLKCEFQDIPHYELMYEKFNEEYNCFLIIVLQNYVGNFPVCKCVCEFAQKDNLRWYTSYYQRAHQVAIVTVD